MDLGSTDVSKLIRHGESFLTNSGVPNARRNAEWLLAHVLACRSADLYLDTHYVPAPVQVTAYERLLERRGSREPLQYILGMTEFMSLPFYAVPGVFIPRPDTEVLVEGLEEHLARANEQASRAADSFSLARTLQSAAPRHVLDLCCGSGVIAVSIVKRVAGTVATAVDVSTVATDVAAKNAELNCVGRRVECICAEAIEFLESSVHRFDVIACNPPYVPTADIASLAPEIQLHEPRLSLDGGRGGLDFYCAIVPVLRRSLRAGGAAFFEVGAGQAEGVCELLAGDSLADVKIYKDYAGNNRVVVARES
jgi:release factor glutamine methyltransferase